MNDVQNIGLTHMDENHDFVQLYNATSKNETENEHLNESIYPNNDNFCKYYTLVRWINQNDRAWKQTVIYVLYKLS